MTMSIGTIAECLWSACGSFDHNSLSELCPNCSDVKDAVSVDEPRRFVRRLFVSASLSGSVFRHTFRLHGQSNRRLWATRAADKHQFSINHVWINPLPVLYEGAGCAGGSEPPVEKCVGDYGSRSRRHCLGATGLFGALD